MGLRSARKYIILAEDNPADVQLVQMALTARNIDSEVHVVIDGDEAIRLIERIDRDPALNCPQLLLLDLHLPRRDGVEVLSCLRASERCGQTPVIVMTSSDSPHDAENATRHAALHYFRKPSTLEEFMSLGDVVKEILAREQR